jgi:hypothetical protein
MDQDRLRDFLHRKVGPDSSGKATSVTEAVIAANERYVRHMADKARWMNLSQRNGRLRRIERHTRELHEEVSNLDSVAFLDMHDRLGSGTMERLQWELTRLGTDAAQLLKEAQKTGRPKNLAQERWVRALSEIYEAFAGKPARISGSASGPSSKRGPFYEFLEICVPDRFVPRLGFLDPTQVRRILNTTRSKSAADSSIKPRVTLTLPVGSNG